MKKTWKFFAGLLAGFLAYMLIMMVAMPAMADETQAWILRRPKDKTLIQKSPGEQPYQYWRFLDNDPPVGSSITLTGNQSGDWLECRCDYLHGQPVAWIKKGYVVYDPVTECHQMAYVKQHTMAKGLIGGSATCEFNAGDVIEVYYRSAEYCTTRWGFVRTDDLDFDCDETKATKKRGLPWDRYDYSLHDYGCH